MKHQTGGTRWPSGNILVQTNCLDITMAWKTFCKNVATRVVRFALHIIFCLGLGGQLPRPCPSSNEAPAGDLFSKWRSAAILDFCGIKI